MDKHTQTVIDKLFQRLGQVEKDNANRDRDAESLIEKHVVQQPSAPYYMAQTMIMQEATIKQLQAQIETLQEQQTTTSSGGFFSNLFGGNNRTKPNARRSRTSYGRGPDFGPGQYGAQPGGYSPGYGGYQRNSSFLGGALQTAAGVAGGMMLGNMMMDMFSSHRPEEIVDIINDDPTQSMGSPNDMMNNSDFMDNGMGSPGFDNTDLGDQGFADNSMDVNDPFSNGFDNGGFGDNFDSGFDGGGFGDFDDFS